MAFLNPNHRGLAYGHGYMQSAGECGQFVKIVGNDLFAVNIDPTDKSFGILIKDYKPGDMPGIFCMGGVYETDVFEGKYIIMRGRRFNDLRDWNLDPQTKHELRAKGVIKNYGTGGILLTASMGMDEIILVPDEEIGKLPVRETLKTEAIEQKTRFKTGWLVWTEPGTGSPALRSCRRSRFLEASDEDQERQVRHPDHRRCGDEAHHVTYQLADHSSSRMQASS